MQLTMMSVHKYRCRQMSTHTYVCTVYMYILQVSTHTMYMFIDAPCITCELYIIYNLIKIIVQGNIYICTLRMTRL